MAPARKRQRTSEGAIDGPSTSEPEEIEQTDPLSHEKAIAKRDPRTLFVRLLHPDTTTENLTAHFSESYPLKHAVVVTDPVTKKCKGFGFVTFADEEDAALCMKELDGSELLGRHIKVELAQARQRGEDADSAIPRVEVPVVERQPAPKLIVRNLPWSIDTVQKLTKLFLPFGKVKESILPKMADGKLRGFGIVLLRGQKNAEKAVESLNGKEVDGRPLAVDWAADRETWEKERAKEKEQEKQEKAEKKIAARAAKGGEENDDEEQQHIGDDVLDETSDGDDNDDQDDSPIDEDEDDQNDEEDVEEEEEQVTKGPDRTDTTIFIRNLPFTCTDEDLVEHFEQFGSVRYARVVFDPMTEKPRGTGFVCFVNKEDANQCVKTAPKTNLNTGNHSQAQTVLQDYGQDPSGRYTISGRVLIISQAVRKDEAEKLTQDGVNFRNHRDKDKRRLYLLQEGKIPSNSPLYAKLPAVEVKMRDDSASQRKTLVEKNPSLHLSLVRLAVRNIPKQLTSKDLKALARKAVVEFSKDVKDKKRQPLSKEELTRGGDEMKEAEKARKLRGKGIVKQAKIVFETTAGSKIAESEGAGRSRGYGFIEYYTHRSALMGLRWLNGHLVELESKDAEDKKKRLIIEFALENVNVMKRRQEREQRPPRKGDEGRKNGKVVKEDKEKQAEPESKEEVKDAKLARRQQIIQKKRMARRARKKGEA